MGTRATYNSQNQVLLNKRVLYVSMYVRTYVHCFHLLKIHTYLLYYSIVKHSSSLVILILIYRSRIFQIPPQCSLANPPGLQVRAPCPTPKQNLAHNP